MIDDDVCILKGLELAMDKYAIIEFLGTASTCEEGLRLIKTVNPDVIVVDIDLPDGDGFEMIRKARRENPLLECMVVTGHEEDKYVFKALEAGATGYKLKSAGPVRIVEGMIELWEGGSPLSPDIARLILRRFHKPDDEEDTPQLGTKEKEVLELMFKGFSRKELAAILNVSTNTIGTHVKRIYKKLDVSSRSEAIYEATRLGLISLDNNR
ncbi:MAG: response regulator transcription factor [Mariprofundaceae bacterium]|nr:response regulator transcription factor [Mariprofundaceae bacterium]